MASMSAPAAARAVAARSVHLKIFPRPRNLAESREILNVIGRCGEVEMFKHLKYEPVPARNTAIVIFKSAHAAEQAILASPVRFTYGSHSSSITEDGSTSSPTPTSSSDSLDPSPSASALASSQPTDASTSSEPSHITLRYPPMTIPLHPPPSFPAAQPSNIIPEDRPPLDPTLAGQPDPYASDPRPCSIHVDGSRLAHKEYIRRQWYYGGFRVDAGSKPGVDVLRPLPWGLEGLGNSEVRGERGWGVRRREMERQKNGNGGRGRSENGNGERRFSGY
ncbi:MAG: hypothetical protein MMC23_008007 [Stictis urceolatum]|nr:hypothetical protein [Stictis urceolata]